MQFSLKPSDRDPLGQPVGLCIPQPSAPWPSYSRGGGSLGDTGGDRRHLSGQLMMEEA